MPVECSLLLQSEEKTLKKGIVVLGEGAVQSWTALMYAIEKNWGYMLRSGSMYIRYIFKGHRILVAVPQMTCFGNRDHCLENILHQLRTEVQCHTSVPDPEWEGDRNWMEVKQRVTQFISIPCLYQRCQRRAVLVEWHCHWLECSLCCHQHPTLLLAGRLVAMLSHSSQLPPQLVLQQPLSPMTYWLQMCTPNMVQEWVYIHNCNTLHMGQSST